MPYLPPLPTGGGGWVGGVVVGGGRVLLFKPEDYNFTTSRSNYTNKSCAGDVKHLAKRKTGADCKCARTPNATASKLPALLSTTFAV